MISSLAEAPDRQLDLAREMAARTNARDGPKRYRRSSPRRSPDRSLNASDRRIFSPVAGSICSLMCVPSRARERIRSSTSMLSPDRWVTREYVIDIFGLAGCGTGKRGRQLRSIRLACRRLPDLCRLRGKGRFPHGFSDSERSAATVAGEHVAKPEASFTSAMFGKTSDMPRNRSIGRERKSRRHARTDYPK